MIEYGGEGYNSEQNSAGKSLFHFHNISLCKHVLYYLRKCEKK